MIDKKLNTIIRRAFQVAKIKSGDVDLTENELNDARYSLNTMLKSWDNRGFHLWKRKTANLILNKGQKEYSLPDDLCFENIYPTEIEFIEQSAQYFIPMDVENLNRGMTVLIPENLNENEAKIQEVLEDRVRLDKGLFRIIAKDTIVFCGIDIQKGFVENDYTAETSQIELPAEVIADVNDVIFFKAPSGWIERKIISIQNGVCILDEAISDIDVGTRFVVAPILYKKSVTESLGIYYKTIIVKNKKGFAEGQKIVYFDKDSNKIFNEISVIDGNKIVLKEAIEPSVAMEYAPVSSFSMDEDFTIDEFPIPTITLGDDSIIFFKDENIMFSKEQVQYSIDDGQTWTALKDNTDNQVEAYQINKLDGKYYFFYGSSAWYMNEGEFVAIPLNLLGHQISNQNYYGYYKKIINKYEDKYYITDFTSSNAFLVSEDGINFSEKSVPTTAYNNSYMFDSKVFIINGAIQAIYDLRTDNFTPITTDIIHDSLDYIKPYMIGDNVYINNVVIDIKTLEEKDIILYSLFDWFWVTNIDNAYIYFNSQGFCFTKDFIDYKILLPSDGSLLGQYYFDGLINEFYAIFNDKVLRYKQPIKKELAGKCPVIALDIPAKKPQELNSIRLYSFLDDREEYPCLISRNDFDKLPRSDSDGEPTQIYYDRQLENGIINVWNTPNENCLYLEIDYVEALDPLDTSREMPDFTDQFVEAVIYNLAYKLAVEYGVPVEDLTVLKNEADTMLEMADLHDNEDCSIHIRPGR